MKASQLSEEITVARQAEFGDQHGFPARYFNQHVTVSAPTGEITPRSPRYCATNWGAGQISAVLYEEWGIANGNLGIGIVLSDPMGYVLGGGWHDSEPVPYLVFQVAGDPNDVQKFTGPKVNAALLLDYFNHGIPAAQALANCKIEVYGKGK